MTNIKLIRKEGDPVTVYDARDMLIDFRLGTVNVNFYTESGPQTGSYAFEDLKDIDWEVSGSEESLVSAQPLNTYQQRAIRNLPPKLPGQPDYTYEPVMPKVASPTPVQKVDEEKAEVGGSGESKVPNLGMDEAIGVR